MNLTLKLDINEKEILNSMLKEMVKQFNILLAALSTDNTIKRLVGEEVESQIKKTPEFVSLLSGDLAAIFGLTDSSKILENIIVTIKNSIEVKYSPAIIVGETLTTSITVSVLLSDFSDVLTVPGTSYSTDGGDVNWLEWLLTAGDEIVISDYTAVLINSPLSRTGHAIMKKSSRGFRVPPEFSGTVNNNWLTRAIEGLEDPIGNILFLELDKRI